MPFIASFSDSPNHLPLWRYYGDMSFGFAIGFESKLKLIGDQPTLARHPIRAKVNYGEKSCNQVINTLIELYTDFIHKAGAVARSEQGMQKAAKIILNNLLLLLPSFKAKDFEDEDEVRLILPQGTGIKWFDKSQIFYTERQQGLPILNGKIIAEHSQAIVKKRYCLSKFESASIKEIIIGSRCNYKKAKEQVSILLEKNGYTVSNIKISQADSVLR